MSQSKVKRCQKILSICKQPTRLCPACYDAWFCPSQRFPRSRPKKHDGSINPKKHGPYVQKATPRALPWGSQKRVSQAYKPSSVVDGHLSRPAVTGRLQRLPGSAAGHRIFASILHQVGFASRTSRQAAGELLPRLSILTSRRDAVYFCCTFLGVASTGDYPAPCPMELGLSSSAKAAAAIQLTHTYRSFYHSS